MKTTGKYIITGGEDGKKRLGVLSEVLHPYEMTLLQQRGLSSDMSFLDVGCGGGHVSVMASNIVGDSGRVVAIDFDKEIIQLDEDERIEKGISNILYRTGSAYEMTYSNEFDMVYARFLLSHLTEPQVVLKNMVAAATPGGRIVVEDIDFNGHFCYPSCSAFDDYVQLFQTTASQRGQSANIGPVLYSLFANAGLRNIGFDVIQPAFNNGDGKWMAYITMDKIKDAVIEQGLADEDRIQNLLEGLKTFTQDETTIISLPRIFRVWGTKL